MREFAATDRLMGIVKQRKNVVLGNGERNEMKLPGSDGAKKWLFIKLCVQCTFQMQTMAELNDKKKEKDRVLREETAE